MVRSESEKARLAQHNNHNSADKKAACSEPTFDPALQDRLLNALDDERFLIRKVLDVNSLAGSCHLGFCKLIFTQDTRELGVRLSEASLR